MQNLIPPIIHTDNDIALHAIPPTCHSRRDGSRQDGRLCGFNASTAHGITVTGLHCTALGIGGQLGGLLLGILSKRGQLGTRPELDGDPCDDAGDKHPQRNG